VIDLVFPPIAQAFRSGFKNPLYGIPSNCWLPESNCWCQHNMRFRDSVHTGSGSTFIARFD